MSHKKIIKSCKKKLIKDVKHYKKEEKEASTAARKLKIPKGKD